MKRPNSQPSPDPGSNPPPGGDIDAVYGLEPVFEPGCEPGGTPGMMPAFHTIQCPYCGERFDTLVDPGSAGAIYIEDCQICCQPIEFELSVDSRGAFANLLVRRS